MKQQKISSTPASGATLVPPATAQRSRNVTSNLGVLERSSSAEGKRLTFGRLAQTGRERPAASLLFASGDRSGVDQVRALAAADPSVLVSYDPEEGTGPGASAASERWVEVFTSGLTFDLHGLAPGAPQPLPPSTHRYGLPADFCDGALEAISLRPGPQIGSGRRMLPVLRGLARLTAMLASLPGVRAVGWHAARTWSAPGHFRGSVLRWVEGGAFPGLGLTALASTPQGGLRTEGLALFTGQELRLAPELVHDRSAGARLALRLLHWLVEHGPLDTPAELPGPSGEPLMVKPSGNRRFVEASRG